jgi:hypothetical protein
MNVTPHDKGAPSAHATQALIAMSDHLASTTGRQALTWQVHGAPPPQRPRPRLQQAAWFAGVSAIAFVVPLVFSSCLELQHDVYYLVYVAAIGAVLGAYLRACKINVSEVVGRNWKLSLALGLVSGVFVTWSVLGRIDSTPHPSGGYFAFEILWRGVLYGIVDALLLSAFPGLIALELMQRNVAGAGRRISYGVLTLALVW